MNFQSSNLPQRCVSIEGIKMRVEQMRGRLPTVVPVVQTETRTPDPVVPEPAPAPAPPVETSPPPPPFQPAAGKDFLPLLAVLSARAAALAAQVNPAAPLSPPVQPTNDHPADITAPSSSLPPSTLDSQPSASTSPEQSETQESNQPSTLPETMPPLSTLNSQPSTPPESPLSTLNSQPSASTAPDRSETQEGNQPSTLPESPLSTLNSQPSTSTDWPLIAEQIRLQELQMAQHFMALGRRRVLAIAAGTAPQAAYAEVARLTALGSKLARRAIGDSDPEMAVSATAKNHLLFEYEESIKQIVNARAEEAAREKAQSAPESSAPAAASSPPSPPSQPVNPVPDVPKAAPAATTAPVPPAPAAPPEPVPSGRYGWPKPPRIRHPSIHITYPKSK